MKLLKKPADARLAYLSLGAFALLGTVVAAAEGPVCAEPIRAVMLAQTTAWNEGNISGFMRHYWKSDELTFCSGGNTVRGWKATLDRYLQRYQPDSMGQLAFDELEITAIGDDHALVLGRWHLVKPPENVAGNFSLVFRRIEGVWVIIHDHTSKSPDAEPEP